MTDPIDQDVGFWIKNVPYFFIPGDGVEKSKRWYFGTIPITNDKKKRCGWPANYFEATKVAHRDLALLRNGRNYYGTVIPVDKIHSLDDVILPIPNDQRSLNCQELSTFGDEYYDISALICTQMKETPDSWFNMMRLLQLCPPTTECDPCTRIGYKIARSLVRIASLRIFADPEQSIMELPVNSVDAYSSLTGSGRKIGKFGMGFFSMFYWLVDHPKRSLRIESYSKDAEGYCAYTLVIKEVKGVLSFSLQTKPGCNVTETGFWVYLDASEDPLTDDEVKSFTAQLAKLRYVQNVSLFVVDGDDLPASALFRNSTKVYRSFRNYATGYVNPIYCALSRRYLSVEDFATGVTIDVLFESLLVPSISTKTIKASEEGLLEYVPDSKLVKVEPEQTTSLLILIGGVAIVSIESKKFSRGYHYVLDLPPYTRVPVSRDDFILTPKVKTALEKGISDLFQSAEDILSDVSELQAFLQQYADFTPSYENRQAVKGAENDYYQANKHRLVPVTHKNTYLELQKMAGNKTRFIVSERYDQGAIEKWIDANIKSDDGVWYGIKVVFLDSTTDITDAGLSTYLFISNKYRSSLGKEWIQTITTSYFKLKLYPKGATNATASYEKYETWTKGVKKTLLPVTNAFLLKLDSLDVYFTFNKEYMYGTLMPYLIRYSNFLTEEMYTSICNEAIKKMSTFKGSQTYGSSKQLLFAPTMGSYGVEMISEYKLPDISMEKCKEVLYQHVVYVLRSIPEKPTTTFGFETQNSPFSVFKRVGRSIPGGDLFKEMMLQADDLVEINAMMAGVFADMDVYTTHIDHSREASRAFISHHLSDIRSRKYSGSTIVFDYEWWDSVYFAEAQLTRRDYITDRYTAKEWSRTMQQTSEIKTYTGSDIDPRQGVSLKTSKLIKYLFENPAPTGKDGDVDFYRTAAASKVEDSPLQIIEIAVNEGTVKPFIEASETELVQNSVDAGREAKKASPKGWSWLNERIDITVEATADRHTVVLSIIDKIGMPAEAFLSVAIPFLSTKIPSELVTGEMGSGFFNVYRESSKVEIVSVKDGTRRTTIDTPVRDARGRVIDIEKRVNVTTAPPSLSNGTRINIFIPVKDSFEYVTTVSRITYHATRVLGLSTADSLYFNNALAYISREKAGEFGHYQIFYSDRSANIAYESYLLTKGIPFAPLAEYFREELYEEFPSIKTCMIVNITHGGYTPVQTRTRIKVPASEKEHFVKAARCAGFISVLTEMARGRRREVLDHMDSQSDARQLRFIVYAMPDRPTEYNLFKYGKIYPNTPPVAQIINECIDIIQDKPYTAAIAKKVTTLMKKYSTGYPNVDAMLLKVVLDWLSNKNKHVKAKEIKKGKTKLVEVDADDEARPLVEKWITTYLELAKDIDGFGGRRPAIHVVSSTKPASGWFVPGEKAKPGDIYINTKRWTKKDRIQVEKVLAKKDTDAIEELKDNKVWTDCFAYSFPATTIAHELEHARRKTSHDGTHGPDTVDIPGLGKMERTFDQCANDTYRYVLGKGFYRELFSRM